MANFVAENKSNGAGKAGLKARNRLMTLRLFSLALTAHCEFFSLGPSPLRRLFTPELYKRSTITSARAGLETRVKLLPHDSCRRGILKR